MTGDAFAGEKAEVRSVIPAKAGIQKNTFVEQLKSSKVEGLKGFSN